MVGTELRTHEQGLLLFLGLGVLVCRRVLRRILRRILRRFEFPTKRLAGAAVGGEDGIEYQRRPFH